MFVDPVSKIKKLKHVGNLQHYLDEFDMKLSNINLSEARGISHFLEGLKEEIEMFVRLFNPTSLQAAYALNKVQEVLWSKRIFLEKCKKLWGYR